MSNKRIIRFKDYVFVLWGDKFEELAATVFVTELREVGLRVKLVSFDRRRISGTYGLSLLPDFTLDQVLPLASKAIGVIIPCGSLGAKQLEEEPHLVDFFRQAHANNAQFVMGNFNRSKLAEMKLFPTAVSNHISIYPENEDLVKFARQLAVSLSQAKD